MQNIAIKTENLTKKFGNRITVNKLNIEIKKSEIFSILGTNETGKSTTIKMLNTINIGAKNYFTPFERAA